RSRQDGSAGDQPVGGRRRLRSQDGRGPGRSGERAFSLRDQRGLQAARRQGRRGHPRRDAHGTRADGDELDRHGRQRSRLLHRHLRQGRTGRAGVRRAAHDPHSRDRHRRHRQGMTERLDNDAVVERALDEVRRRDGLEAEAYLRDSHGTSIEVIEGKVESAEVETERGVGVRVLDAGRVGFAYTSDLSPAGIAECVDLAVANARVTSPDESIAFAATPIPPNGELQIFDSTYESHDVAEKTELALAIEAAARRVDPRITSFYKTSYGDGAGVTVFATTAGGYGTYRSTSFGAGTACVATEGEDKQIGGFGDGGRTFDTLDAETIGAEAARRALEKLRARTFKTQRIDIVLEPYRAMELVGAISSLFSAENVLKGKSLLAGKIEQRVASDVVTLRDEGRRIG